MPYSRSLLTTDQQSMTGAEIRGIDYALPSRRVDSAELTARHPEWQMEAVTRRGGVRTRYWCAEGETALDLAQNACLKLRDRFPDAFASTDVLMFCTQTPDHPMPPNACLLQSRLGLPKRVAAWDYTLACSGFVYGLYMARALIASGSAKHILLVTADSYSKIISNDDRGPATLFGDAAAATLIAAGGDRIGPFSLATDGTRSQCFYIPAGGMRLRRSEATAGRRRDRNGNLRSDEDVYMNGPAVIDFIKKEVPVLVRDFLTLQKLTVADIDLVVFHQASQVTLDALTRMLRIPSEKLFNNLSEVGNTVSASIPLALREAEQRGVLTQGMLVLVVGFGVGLSWGAGLIKW